MEGPDKQSKQVQLKQHTSGNGMRHAMRHEALVMTAGLLHMCCVQMLSGRAEHLSRLLAEAVLPVAQSHSAVAESVLADAINH